MTDTDRFVEPRSSHPALSSAMDAAIDQLVADFDALHQAAVSVEAAGDIELVAPLHRMLVVVEAIATLRGMKDPRL